ncbi:MAG: hypothetical protein PHV59_00995, partial [Victivallales bacterium]|nr:hypothetical protein [Victivallales bacterium]
MLTATLGIAAEPEINLLYTGDFKPVVMHGRPSAAYGWSLNDLARLMYRYRSKSGKYLSGENCFSLGFKDGAMTISFPDPLHPFYKDYWLEFSSQVSQPAPPAPQYLAAGRVKFNKGLIVLGNGKVLRPGEDWQAFEFKTARSFDQFKIYPKAGGAAFSVADFKNLAVYPRIGGEINLPDGGKLTRLLLPEDASYLMRWSIALWRGGLWKLTGTSLPLEIT